MNTTPGDHANIFVTGATGFVGSVLVRQLVEAGASVRILRRPSSRMDLLKREGVAGTVEQVRGTLEDARSLRRAMRGTERVYHVAALVGPGRWVSREALRQTNTEGTANVVNAALATGVQRLVLTSSIAALAPPAAEPHDQQPPIIDENASWARAIRPPSPYARSKCDAEREVHRGIAEGLDAVIVNPGLIFGRGRPGEGTRRLVDLARRGRLLAAPPGTTCTVDVEDVAAGHRRAMRLGETGRRYVLGAENLSWKTTFATLARAFGQAPPRFRLPPALLQAAGFLADAFAFLTRTTPAFSRQAAQSLVARHHYSNRRAREELGCQFRPFAATVRRLAEEMP